MVSKSYFLLIVTFLLVGIITPGSAQTVVRGIVTDSISGEKLSYVSVYVEGTKQGAMTDGAGRFAFKTSSVSHKLVASTVGYKLKRIALQSGKTSDLRIKLVPTSYQLSEVIVKPRREHYKRKNNPAVDFVKKIIESRDANDPHNHEYYQFERYEKTTFALNNFDEKRREKGMYKRFDFLENYVDSSLISGKPILTVSTKETLENDYYRKSPQSNKRIIVAKKHNGVDDMFSEQSMQVFLNEVFQDVDLFKNDVSLLTNRFVSPLSSIGPMFYKYYLMDTVQIAGHKCMDLTFVPFNSESFGFTGHLFVTLDSTNFVKRVQLNVPKNINLNFVDYMSIEQEYDRAPDGTRLITKDNITVEFKMTPKSNGLYARKMVSYRNHSFDKPADESIFKGAEKEIETDDATVKPESFWVEHRHEPIPEKENSVDKLLKQLRSNPVYYYTEKALSILFTGYIPTSEQQPKFDIGPMNTLISSNELEGARFRVGGLTTAYLNKHLFGRGYVAYGTKDEKLKYSGELEYSFKKKKEYANEFPINSLKVKYDYDINQLGQYYLYTNMDNIFLSFKRQTDDKITYLRRAQLTYTHESHSGFSFGTTLRYKTEYASPYVPFQEIQSDGETRPVKQYSMGEAEFKIRYAPNEKFFQTQWNRFPVSLDAPVFNLSHTVARKGFMGADYNYNHTEFGFQKRFWFSAFGYTDVILKAGKVWDKVPFPLLIIPNANLSYTIQYESYSQMNAMEFLNDQYASWDVTYFGNGVLFNRIPAFRRLQWREVLTFRGMYGDLSKKNNPLYSKGLYEFPSGSYEMGKTPYMEAGVGVENIFKFLRFDYVWRLTYRDNPGIDKQGLRISLHVTF